MTDFIDAFRRAIGLIGTLDPSLVEILVLSLKVSFSAVVIASLLGFAIGGALSTGSRDGARCPRFSVL